MDDAEAVDAAEAADEITDAPAEARRIRRPRDMALSLAVLFVPILIVLAIGRFFYGDSTTGTVDPSTALSGAVRASMAPFPSATPPAGWKIVSAQYKDGVLRIGYLTPGDKGVQIAQTNKGGDTFVKAELSATARKAGTTEIGGVEWQQWTGRAHESALVRTAGTQTVLIVGEVGASDLVTLAAYGS